MRQWGWKPVGRRGLAGALVALIALLLAAAPVFAQGAVQDAGNMFSAQTRQNVANTAAQIERDTGKQIAVRTVANLGGKDVGAAADQVFRDLNLNGALIFASKDDKKLAIKVGTNTRQLISVSEEGAIRDQLTAAFAKGDFDGGLTNAVSRIGNDLRAGGRTTTTGATGQPAPSAQPQAKPGFPWGIILLVLIGGIILAVVLARRASRNAQAPIGGGGPGYGSGGYGPQQYGGGYGPNYGPGGGGGGGFGSAAAGGLVGGIGGAIVGNAIYDRLRDRGGDDRGDQGGTVQAGDWNSGNDYGQPADSPADVGSWGDSGGSSVGNWGSSGNSFGGNDSGVSSGDWGGGSDSGGGGGDWGGSSDSGGGGDSSS